ncbi:MAG: pseudouridine synthase [Dehalococcoidales bacterium]|nr:pseudouridine synthase [Dehalococcoidales bacterium]
MAQQPVIKLLTASGIGSRRKIAALIKRGGVAVNGKVIESFNEPVDSDKDVITIDGKRAASKKEPDVYLMLNKPKGIVSSTSDDRGRKTVIDILPEKYRKTRIYPVGRLDKDSTGLILLTNDGNLTFRLTHPRFEQEKEYLVQIEGELKPEEKAELEKGIYLDDGKTHPAKVKLSRYPPFGYSVAIHEGKKHQVRRIFAAVGHDVLELKRIRLGSLKLNTLPEGETRELSPAEIESLSKGAMRQKAR